MPATCVRKIAGRVKNDQRTEGIRNRAKDRREKNELVITVMRETKKERPAWPDLTRSGGDSNIREDGETWKLRWHTLFFSIAGLPA